MIVGENHVVEMQNRLWKSLTGLFWWRQAFQCPVQIVGKEAGHAPLEWGKVRAIVLRVGSKERAKGVPWIAFERLAVAARPSVRDYVAAERIAGQI